MAFSSGNCMNGKCRMMAKQVYRYVQWRVNESVGGSGCTQARPTTPHLLWLSWRYSELFPWRGNRICVDYEEMLEYRSFGTTLLSDYCTKAWGFVSTALRRGRGRRGRRRIVIVCVVDLLIIYLYITIYLCIFGCQFIFFFLFFPPAIV